MKQVAIVTGCGANFASLTHAFAQIGVSALLTQDATVIRTASHVVLPGVGAAPSGMTALRAAGLAELIPTLSQPILGICLGMQLLGTWSEEGNTSCLGILPSRVQKLSAKPHEKVPHMGWNTCTYLIKNAPLLDGISPDTDFYFTHSYAMAVNEATVARSDYAQGFSAIIQYQNFYGTQFHPEKSGMSGRKLLMNFIRL